MDTSKLKKFAQFARRTLIGQVGAKLDSVLAEGAAARREHPEAVKKLEVAIATDGKRQVIERVAYTWFNRFCALRYMDVNDLNPVRVVSPLPGQFQPEILAEAKAGNIDEGRVPEKVRGQIRAQLDGRSPSQDPQAEAYQLLLVAICNDWHKAMPFLFERIDDFTELLMPEDLLSNNSILAYTREAMTPDVCEDVEVIGWLYQFYISEKKDEVFAGLKKNQKITPENIPSATQLFTPHWIVRYLVENSLGRLWMLNRPGSKLAQQMDYYIAPEEPEDDFLRVSSPEEIKVCDPACGSGHMLTYAFDLLYAIYEEEGYDPAEIPETILTHNLYGIEIDDRAGALAAFALVMKAASRRKRFLRRPVQPNVCVLENVAFKDGELADYTATVGRDLFTSDLRETLSQFAEAKNFGSLIVPKLGDLTEVARLIATKDFESNLFLRDVHTRVQAALRIADYLSPKYHVVVANPPYMGWGGMNQGLKAWVERKFPNSKQDLMTCFMERSLILLLHHGILGMINIPSWMFLISFEQLRLSLIRNASVRSLLHLGRGIFGADFGTVAFCLENSKPSSSSRGIYRRLFDAHVQVRAPEKIERLFRDHSYNCFVVDQMEFLKIPGYPFAYWPTSEARSAFQKGKSLDQFASIGKGFDTGDNDRFLRLWHEVESPFDRWIPCQKGGPFRKWYGNNDYVADWQDDGATLKAFPKSNLRNSHNYFKRGLTWTRVSSGSTAFRYFPSGQLFESTGPCLFSETHALESIASFLNSKVTLEFLKVLAPMLDFQSGHISNLPMVDNASTEDATKQIGMQAISITKSDWDAYETSWDFTTLPLLSPNHRQVTLAETYAGLRSHWRRVIEEMQLLEEENNRIFINAYGLQDELTTVVPPQEITLTCNPAYHYGGMKSEAELEDLQRADTMGEFLSYAVGCMFGRYSLDAPGLILANKGEGFEDYLKRIPEPSFPPDRDNVIPILDGDWFADDMADRFRHFLRLTFGEERRVENLAFIETALGKDIRRFFLRDFYEDHVRRYKKRPIYWLFSSPKGTFNALVYMHRYRPDTVSTVLDYLREFRRKLDSHRNELAAISISSASAQADKAKALKEIESVSRNIDELDGYEREILYPLATRRLEIDLDDGVKVNYAKFGSALKPIKGLGDAED
ncbi:BREX-1 system adenine-specific DNA-methyltransferase PglX [Mesorhizobium sp. M1338]|uniref:BREX-1 system adenine-specific DNA-methyltransferase PglX n=1 Tax=Mesorhizobium sp. M1338 TaxID=2957085 RepID=UPI003338AA32